MRLRLAKLCVGTAILAIGASSSWAGPALDDGKDPSNGAVAPSTATTDASGMAPTEDNPVEYGAGIGVRHVWVPKAILELFVARAADGASNTGIRFEAVRRRGTTELQLGFEYEHLTVGEGVWINRGENVGAGDEADYILSPNHSGHDLGWFTIEFTFMNHAEINKKLSFRYGGGAGLGIITGELHHYNIICNGATNNNPEPGCVPPRFSGTGSYSEGTETDVKYDLPPVFPVVNAIIGLQIKPIEKLTINIETGIRTVPFFGITSAYFF